MTAKAEEIVRALAAMPEPRATCRLCQKCGVDDIHKADCLFWEAKEWVAKSDAQVSPGVVCGILRVDTTATESG